MVLKKSYPALEHATSAEGTGVKVILHGLPDDLLAELEDFVQRNSLGYVEKEDKKIHYCCSHCLKAHAIKKAKELKLDEKRMSWLNDLFGEHSEGHDGYYIDEDKLVKI